MYVPDAFRQDDPTLLWAFVRAYPFATVITHGADGILVSHLPLLAGDAVLRGHLARENPQLRHVAEGAEVLAVFHGPHGYVSPSVYAEPHPAVPTWNYVVVHAHGRVRLVDDQALRAIVDDLVEHFDASGWRAEEDGEYLPRMLGAIAGFEIAVERLLGKWKLSQNRSPDDRARVATWLERGDAASRALAAVMRSQT
jgi:transcriptional regulator